MPLRKPVSILWIPAFMGMTTGGDLRVCNSHYKQEYPHGQRTGGGDTKAGMTSGFVSIIRPFDMVRPFDINPEVTPNLRLPPYGILRSFCDTESLVMEELGFKEGGTMTSIKYPTATSKVTEDPKPTWSKPTIRVMTVSFTQSSTGDNMGPETATDLEPWNTQYIPPSS